MAQKIVYHTVEKGESIITIANKYGISRQELINQNLALLRVNGGIIDGQYKAVAGQTLTITLPDDGNKNNKKDYENEYTTDIKNRADLANNVATNQKPTIKSQPKKNDFILNAIDISNVLNSRTSNKKAEYNPYFDRKLDNILVVKNEDNNKTLSEKEYNNFTEFNRYNTLNGVPDFYENGYGYVFFVTPNLNIGSSDSSNHNFESDSFLYNTLMREPHIIKSLTNDLEHTSPIIKVLTNNALSFETRDLSMKTIQTHETFEGYKTLMPISFIESMSGDQFSVSYRESPDLEVMKLHKIWLDYIYFIRRGKFRPDNSTLQAGELDFMTSVYYFATKPDARTITYFAKYTGVAPTSIPYSTLSYKRGEHASDLEFSYSYSYMYKEDLDPNIIYDFKQLFNNYSRSSSIDIIELRPEVSRGYGKGPKFDYQLIFGNEDYSGAMFKATNKGAGYLTR